MKLNNKKLLLLGLILGLSLMLTGCLDSAPGEDSSGDTKVWDTYDNASTFAVKYKAGWQTYEYEDVLNSIANEIADNEEFQKMVNNLEQEYGFDLKEEISSLSQLEDIVLKIDEVSDEVWTLMKELDTDKLHEIYTEETLNQLKTEYNLTESDIVMILKEQLETVWLQLGKVKAYLTTLKQELKDSALIMPERLDFNFDTNSTDEEEAAEINNEFLFAASTLTETELQDQGLSMPQSKEEFYQGIKIYAEDQYGTNLVSQDKFELDDDSYAAYKIEVEDDSIAADKMGNRQTEIIIYKDGRAGFVRYQGTADGHKNNSDLAETMAKSFQFK